MRLLLVEDDVMVASGIKLGLTDAGYAVDWVGSGERAEDVLRNESFDAAIIDIGLPGMDGLELTRRLRRPDMPSRSMPVLILTARDALHDRVQGLDLGADDYMVKPFELPELLARLRALLRRAAGRSHPVIRHGALEIDPAAHTVLQAGVPVELSPREFAVLLVLLESRGRVQSRQQLEARLYNWQDAIESNALEVHIHHLRRKLGSTLIHTMRGVGYFIPRDEAA